MITLALSIAFLLEALVIAKQALHLHNLEVRTRKAFKITQDAVNAVNKKAAPDCNQKAVIHNDKNSADRID